jgi:hypothetical protein
MLDVNGTIFSRQGFKFPDGTVQTTATVKSPWVTYPNGIALDSTLTNRNVTVDNLYVTQSMNIGNFKVSAPQPAPAQQQTQTAAKKDTISSPNAVTIASAAQAINLSADSVKLGRFVGVTPGATPGSSRLNVQGDIGVSGNLRLANLAGSGDRTLVVDSVGNLKVTQPIILCGGLDPFWKTNGNNVPTGCAPFIGPTSAGFDFIIKTGDLPSNNNFERMRVKETGEVGIGINAPQHNLHLHSDVLIDLGDPNNPIQRHANCCLLPDTTLNFDSLGTRFTLTPPTGHVFTSLSTFQITNDLTRPANLPPTDDNGLVMGMDGANGFLRLQEHGNLDIHSSGGLTLNSHGNLYLGNDQVGAVYFQTANNFLFHTPNGGGPGGYSMFIKNNGNIGMGTLVPGSKLVVRGGDATSSYSALNVTDNVGTSLLFVRDDGYVGIGTATPQTTPQAKLDVNGNGYFSGPVAINTATLSNPFPGNGYMLAVKGKIIAEEYVAKLTPWPDYVFKKDYNLKDLNDLDQFIKEKEHLPGIPTAIEAEKNGVSLGEMAKIQMEKIEELTLYMIQMHKELQSLKAENEKLKKENK